MSVWAKLKAVPIVFPLACLATVAMIFISESSYWQSVGTLDELGKMGAVRVSIQRLERGVLAAESAQRGYLLTQRAEYLQPYHQALEEIETAFKAIETYYDGEAKQSAAVTKLRAQTKTKLSELALTIDMLQQGKRQASLELTLSNIGKDHMETIAQLSAELLSHETRNVSEGRADLFHTLLLRRVGVAALSGLSLLALALYLRQMAAVRLAQLQLKRALQVERDGLEIAVANRTAELSNLALHLHTAREDERSRVARDLHDELGALLTSAKLDAARIKSRLTGNAPEALERLTHLVDTLNSGIVLKRRIIEGLRPSALDHLGLVEALAILARDFADRSDAEVITTLQAVALTPESELVAYRIVQEAITNIGKYAQARHVWITLAPLDGQVRIAVRDDGVGFHTSSLSSSAHGLLGMRFRVEAAKGVMVLSSTPGVGTAIEVRLPALPGAAA